MMNSFAGIVSLTNAPVEPRLERSLIAVIARRCGGRPSVQRATDAIFVQENEVLCRSERGTLFVADARLDNRDELTATARAAASTSDAELIRFAFETRGDAGIASVLGAFAFAHWDQESRQLTLARDCVGLRPIFFYRAKDFVIFASLLPDLLAISDVPRQIDETTMASFLASDHREKERTVYAGINRVPSRTRVTITQMGVRMQPYWSPRLDAPPPFSRDEDYIERARELFDRAVARCLRDAPRIAILTSGGLDSSAVAVTAARLGHGDVTCYTGVPPDDFDVELSPKSYLDERPKVEALVAMHPSLRVRYVTPRGAHPLDKESARLFVRTAVPVRGASHIGWFETIQDAIAQDGHCLVLNGDNGNIGISWAGAFSLATLAREGRYATLLKEARAIAHVEKRALGRVLLSELVMRMAPRAMQRLVSRLRGNDPDDVSRSSLLNPDAIVALDLHRRWEENGFDPRYRVFGSPARRRAHQLFDQLQIGRDSWAMNQAAARREERDPHSDRDLLEFCLAVPETLYRRNGVRRWFARQVFADRLPPVILNETRRGAQAPNWFESVNQRKPIFAAEIERIEASPLARRLIDVPRLKRLFSEWPKDAHEAQTRSAEYRYGLDRAVHVAQFIRWVEGGNG